MADDDELPPIRGTPPSDPDREETDSGFAQNDRVHHAKRGVGTVTGFFGEFVCVVVSAIPITVSLPIVASL